MQGEQSAGNEGPHAIAGQTLGEHKDEADDERMEQKTHQMEAVRPQTKELIAEEVSQGHHRAVVIGDVVRVPKDQTLVVKISLRCWKLRT